MQEERRRSPRRQPDSPQSWSLPVSATVRVIDIGLGGALLATNRSFAVGESFEIRLVLKHRPCVARGKIARVVKQEGALESEAWQLGISFEDWDRDSREYLNDYLTRPIR